MGSTFFMTRPLFALSSASRTAAEELEADLLHHCASMLVVVAGFSSSLLATIFCQHFPLMGVRVLPFRLFLSLSKLPCDLLSSVPTTDSGPQSSAESRPDRPSHSSSRFSIPTAPVVSTRCRCWDSCTPEDPEVVRSSAPAGSETGL